MDVARVVPEARQAVLEAARVYVNHTRPWFIGLIVYGSAVKGDFLPGCSDIDLRLYLEEEAFEEHHALPLNLCLSLHRELARVDPSPFTYIQCHALPGSRDGDPQGQFLGPIPGTYHLLLGKLPVAEATDEELLSAAHEALREPETTSASLAHKLLDHGGGRLSADVRLLVTKVWPTLYQVLCCRFGRPQQAWGLPKEAAVALIPEQELLGQQIRAFHRSLQLYCHGSRGVDQSLSIVSHGLRFLREAREWHRREFE